MVIEREEEPQRPRPRAESGPVGDDAVLASYLREISQVALLTAAEEAALAIRVEHGDGQAAAALTRANLRLVVSIARRHQGYGVPLSDLIQEGNQGLMRAVQKFRASYGYRFSTYATWWIRQAIARGVVNNSRNIRLPVYLSERITRMKRVGEDLFRKEGRRASREELGGEMGLSVHDVDIALQASRPTASLEMNVGKSESSLKLGDVVPSPTIGDPVDKSAHASLRGQIDRCLESLPERERDVIRYRFGLDGTGPLTLEQVGQRLGVTRERIRQLEARALGHLRASRCAAGLEVFLDEE